MIKIAAFVAAMSLVGHANANSTIFPIRQIGSWGTLQSVNDIPTQAIRLRSKTTGLLDCNNCALRFDIFCQPNSYYVQFQKQDSNLELKEPVKVRLNFYSDGSGIELTGFTDDLYVIAPLTTEQFAMLSKIELSAIGVVAYGNYSFFPVSRTSEALAALATMCAADK